MARGKAAARTVLDWRSRQHFDHSGDQPCVLCQQPTPMRSDRGKPVHKVCAEEWLDAHQQEDDSQ